MAEKFEIPKPDEDLIEVVDGFGRTWVRGHIQWTHRSKEGNIGEAQDWKTLLVKYGPLKALTRREPKPTAYDIVRAMVAVQNKYTDAEIEYLHPQSFERAKKLLARFEAHYESK